jgi:hypothetical protein
MNGERIFIPGFNARDAGMMQGLNNFIRVSHPAISG